MIDPIICERLLTHLRAEFPNGPNSQVLGDTVWMIERTIQVFNRVLHNTGVPLRLALERKTSKAGGRTIRGLIIYSPDLTLVVPMTLSAMLVRVRLRPIFLAHGSGAENLARALLAEIESATAGANDAIHA